MKSKNAAKIAGHLTGDPGIESRIQQEIDSRFVCLCSCGYHEIELHNDGGYYDLRFWDHSLTRWDRIKKAFGLIFGKNPPEHEFCIPKEEIKRLKEFLNK